MRYCKECGNKVGENDLFCEACGAKQEQPEEPVSESKEKPKTTPAVEKPKAGSSASGQSNKGKTGWGIFAIIGVLAAALITVGVLYGIGIGNLNKANADIADLEANVATLQTDLAAEQANVASLETQLAAEQANVASLETQLAAEQANVADLEEQLAAADSEIDQLESDLSAAQQNVADLESELATAQANVAQLQSDLAASEAQVDALQQQLDEIQAKYPLKDFPNLNTLQEWLNDNVQPHPATVGERYASVLKLQQLAADDGYYVSACFVDDYMSVFGVPIIYNTALVGDTLYAFDPDYTGLYEWGEWGR